MERKEIFIIAGWWGAIFGIIEGFLLNLARQFPALLAPYKLSVHVLWVAPVIDILLFLLLGVFLSIILRLIHRRTSALDFQIVIGTYTFVGFICVLVGRLA